MVGFFIAFAVINAITFFPIGVFTFLNNSKSRSNQIHSLFCMAVFFWSISYIFWLSAGSYENALFWARALDAFSIFIPIFFYHWVFVLLGKDSKNPQKIFLILTYLASIFFAVFSFSPLFVRDVEPQLFFEYWPMPGVLHPFYLIIFWGLMFFYTAWHLFRAWQDNDGYKRQQFKYLFFAMLIGFGGGFTNYFLWYGIPIPPWANALVSFWGLSFIYIVFKYRFMDSSFILGKTGIYLLSILPIIFYASAFFYLKNFIKGEAYLLAAEILFALGAAVLFGWAIGFFEKIAGKYFYYAYYNLKEKVGVLSKKINQMIKIEELSKFIASSLQEALKVEKIAIVLKDIEKNNFYIQKSDNFLTQEIGSVLAPQENFLSFWLKESKKILIREEIPFIIAELKKGPEAEIIGEKLKKLEKDLSSAGISAAIPFLIENSLIGLIVLGKKTTGKLYSRQELDLLESLIAQASVAFNNSLAYEELEKRREELEKFYKLTIGRELRMAELKDQIKNLEQKENIK